MATEIIRTFIEVSMVGLSGLILLSTAGLDLGL
jgi:hypothetical protein